MTDPQLTLYVPGSQALVLSLNEGDLEELEVLLDDVPRNSKFYPMKQELNKLVEKQNERWFKDHADRGSKPYY